jgi:hypothetical protein
MDDTPKPAKREAPEPEKEEAAEDPVADAEFIAKLEIDDEFLAMLDEGIWSAENEPLVTSEEAEREIEALLARWREEEPSGKAPQRKPPKR